MNKRNKVIILISLVLVVLFVLYYFFNKQIKSIVVPKTKTENKIATSTGTTTVGIMTKEEQEELGLFSRAVYEVTRDEAGKIIHAQIIDIKKPEPIAFDTMTAEERTAKGIASDTKIQVLLRDSSGKIKSYRVMKDDNDIVTAY